jgi:glycosyltransferase involved in cell wall biosynthesis
LTPRFSIVIPCYNEARYIADTVKSLRGQTFDGSYEIIVVDNNCTDETAQIASDLGARVVREEKAGVCHARQAGTVASTGEIVISADADTTYSPNWLTTIDQSFGTDPGVVAVTGPCRYVGRPLWGRAYARTLFGAVNLVYRMTGRIAYVTATNIAFRKESWTGYDVNLTQGGDELNLMRGLRTKGRVVYVHRNPTYTSSRRLTRGFLYSVFVSLFVYYFLGYLLNRLFKRQVIGMAPAYRNNRRPALNRVQTAVGLVAVSGLLVLPFTQPRHYLMNKSDTVVDYVNVAVHKVGHRVVHR